MIASLVSRALMLALPVIAACAQNPPASPPPPTGGLCNAGPAQFAVGQAYTASLGEDARRRSGARVLRVLRAGEVVTMEFSAQRLTLQLDDAQRVQAARCG